MSAVAFPSSLTFVQKSDAGAYQLVVRSYAYGTDRNGRPTTQYTDAVQPDTLVPGSPATCWFIDTNGVIVGLVRSS